MPNVKIEFRDDTSQPRFAIEADPAHFRGSRNAFGAALHIHVQPVSPPLSKDVPLFFQGSLAWGTETEGLPLPAQMIGRGSAMLTAQISDAQLAAIERRRGSAEPAFQLRLQAAGQSDGSGAVKQYRTGMDDYYYLVPRDRWHDAMAACGFGRIRIVELPPPPEPHGEDWRAAGEALSLASDQLRSGDHSGSATSSRGALERIVAAIEGRLGIAKPKSRWGERVTDAAEALKARHESKGVDAYSLHAEVIKTLYGFESGAAHRLIATRDDAEFALALTTALYAYIVRVPIPEATASDEESAGA